MPQGSHGTAIVKKEQAVTQGASQPLQTVLCQDEGGGQIVVDLDSFVRFGNGIDLGLERLLEQWRHLLPPQPALKRQIRRRPSPK
jgi:hypothetical protein